MNRLVGLWLAAIVLLSAWPSAARAESGGGVLSHRDKLYDVARVGERIWVVGYPGRIIHSPDGGKTWSLQTSGTLDALFAVTFVNAQSGWIVGRGGLVLVTHDGGRKWTPQSSGVKIPLFDVTFLDRRKGWASGYFGNIVGTTDGGTTWSLLRDGEAEGDDAALNGVAFADARRGWAVGEFGTILVTTDGGKSWERQDSGVGRMLFDVSFSDAQRGVVVGSNGQALFTTDGGEAWKAIETGTTDNLTGVATRGKRVWAVGLNGAYLEGSTAKLVPRHVGTYLWLSSLAMTPDGQGVSIGRSGTILLSNDAGKRWTPLSIK
jgi:photosystem II stability/assembly factor-like uncharacterized protein